MLKEEEGGEGEEKIGGARRLRAVTAVAAGWQRWQALEVEVRYAADEVLRASGAWRAAEGRYEAAGEVAELAEERVREARFLVESARSGRHPRQAIAVRRLRCAAEEACRARLAANAAGDEAEEAADEYDAYDAGLGAAEDRADAARERLRVAEREAAWSRAVEVLARLRAARRRSHSVLEGERCVVCVEEHDVVLVVDEEEVFTVPEAPAGVHCRTTTYRPCSTSLGVGSRIKSCLGYGSRRVKSWPCRRRSRVWRSRRTMWTWRPQ